MQIVLPLGKSLLKLATINFIQRLVFLLLLGVTFVTFAALCTGLLLDHGRTVQNVKHSVTTRAGVGSILHNQVPDLLPKAIDHHVVRSLTGPSVLIRQPSNTTGRGLFEPNLTLTSNDPPELHVQIAHIRSAPIAVKAQLDGHAPHQAPRAGIVRKVPGLVEPNAPRWDAQVYETVERFGGQVVLGERFKAASRWKPRQD